MVGQLIDGDNFPIVGEEHGMKDRGSTIVDIAMMTLSLKKKNTRDMVLP
jgi:hypothetical protein